MIRSGSAAIAPRLAGTIDLQISDPVTMLNEVARRYETTERVLMEYVDNSLDDAEMLYRAHNQTYPYDIRIEVRLDLEQRAVTVLDNCRGMTKEVLERTVRNVGESHKRGLPWVNGRFGFGVHSFRATAETLHFFTCHPNSPPLTLELSRYQHQGIKEARRSTEPFPTETGTIVTIGDFDPDWFEHVSVESIKQEIERHFDRLLARPGLTVTVQAAGGEPVRCQPFAYEHLPGQEIRRTLVVEDGGEAFPIEVYLKIARNKATAPPLSFFARGRRVNEPADIKSFIRKSVYKSSVWGHPHLLGYIDVGEVVEPTITRHDFVRTRRRQLFYEAVLSLEKEIRLALAQVSETEQAATFDHLESALGQVLTGVARQDWQQFKPDGAEPDQPQELNLNIKFIDFPSTGQEQPKRSYLAGQTITINLAHPDFKERLAYTRQGQPKISDRLGAYVAALITRHYKDQFYHTGGTAPDHREALFDEQLDFTFRLESAIRKQLPALERALLRQKV